MIKIDRKYYSINNLLLPFDKNKKLCEEVVLLSSQAANEPATNNTNKIFFHFC
jgi:hypothetical protein